MTPRGTLVLVALPGDYGKPRPALIIQSDAARSLSSTVVLPLTTAVREDLPDFRIKVWPNGENGLRVPSEIQVDKPHTVSLSRPLTRIGMLDSETMDDVTRAFALLVGVVPLS